MIHGNTEIARLWVFTQGKLGKSLSRDEAVEDLKFLSSRLECDFATFKEALAQLLEVSDFPLKYSQVIQRVRELQGKGAMTQSKAEMMGAVEYANVIQSLHWGVQVVVIGDAVMAAAVQAAFGSLHELAMAPKDRDDFRRARFAKCYAAALMDPRGGHDGPRIHLLGNPSEAPGVGYLGDVAGAEAIARSEGFRRDFPNARLPGDRRGLIARKAPERLPPPPPSGGGASGVPQSIADVMAMMESMGVRPGVTRRRRAAW